MVKRSGGQHLSLKYLEIYHQFNISGWILGGIVKFELKTSYKLHVVIQQRRLCILRIFALCYLSLRNHKLFKDLVASSMFDNLPKEVQQYICNTVSRPRDTASTRGTTSSEGVAPEVVSMEAPTNVPTCQGHVGRSLHQCSSPTSKE